MNRVRDVLSSLMMERKHKRLRSAAAATMAATVLFGVYGSMIRPAESFANSRASPAVYYDDEPEEIARVLNASDPLHIERTDVATNTGLTQVTADVTGSLLDQSNNITKYAVNLTVDFHIAATDVALLDEHDNSISFDLDFASNKNIQAIIDEQTQTELTGNVSSSDPSYPGSIGTYRLDVTTGVVTIKFDMECQYFKERQGKDIGGGYTFKAYVWNDNNSDEDRNVKIAGYDVVVPIHRYANPSSLKVEKSYNNDFFYPTPGETMQNRKSLGSSFTIKVSGKAKSSDIMIEDTLESDHVHFDLNEATDYPVYGADGSEVSGIRFRVTSITETSKGQLLRGKLYDPSRPDDKTVFDDTFEYSIKCPVAVSDEFLTEDGSAVDTQLLKVISGNNTVNASADGKSDKAAAPIQVNLKADIAKYDGVYDAENNTMHWKTTIYKDNGWWQNGELKIDDFFVNKGYAEFGKKSDITAENGADTERETICKDFKLKVVRGSNENDGEEGHADNTNGIGIDASEANVTYTVDGNGITINMPTDTNSSGQLWNIEPIKEFIIEYDTDVTDLDYGKTVNNWIGLERPTGGFTDQDTKPGNVPKPEIKKTGEYNEDAGTITWTITVNNPNGQELKGLKINDTLTADDGSTVSVDFSKATFSPDIKSQMDIDGNTAVFRDSESFKAPSYTITYVQELDENGSKGVTFKNTADLNNSKDEPVSTDEDQFHVPAEYEVEKDSSFTADGKLQYGITLKNTYNKDLNGTTFTDTITFNGRTPQDQIADNFTVTVPNATKVDSKSELASTGENKGLLYYEETAGDKLILTFFIDDENEKSSSYRVNYTVEPNEGNFSTRFDINVNNTVGWKGKTASTNDTSGKYTSLSEKTGKHDYISNLITWRFTVYNTYEADLGKFTDENGNVKAVTDTMFDKAVSLKIIDADGNDVAKSGDLESIIENGSYTFSEGMTSKSYTFEYTTNPEKSDNYDNVVRYNEDEKSTSIWVGKRSYISKNIAKSSAVSDKGTADVRWNVDIDTYEGGLFEKPITDTMSAESSFASEEVDTSATEHYMTADQFDISEFKISYYTSSSTNGEYGDLNYGEQLTNPEDYFELVKTAGTDDKVTGFTFKVKDDLDPDSEEYALLKKIIRMRISYTTTENGLNALKDENAELGDKLDYKNSSTFDGNKADKTDSREKNPKITKYDVTNGSSNTNENSPKTYRLKDLTIRDGAYILSYKLEVNSNKNFGISDDITITDTLPLGTELENITYSIADKGLWSQSFTEAASYDFDTDTGCAVVKTAATEHEGQIINMYIPAKTHEGGKITIDYTVKLPTDKLDELKNDDNRIVLNNHAETDGDFDMQPIVINASEDAISKQLISGADGVSHRLEYQLDINPGCEKLSLDDTGYLIVEDTINEAKGDKAVAPLKFSEVNANAVKVYIVSGDPETEKPIDFETYKDTFAFYEPQKTTLPVDLPYNVYNDKGVEHIITPEEQEAAKGDVYKLRFKIPDETHIRIKYTYTYDMYVAIDGLDINIKNQAVISGKGMDDESDKKFKYSKAMDDAAQAYTYDYYSLIKVSKENYLETLKGAEFELMRYSIDGGWEYLTGYENKSANAKFGEHYHPIGIVPIGKWQKAGTGDGEVSSGMIFTTNNNGMVTFPNLQKETASDGSIYIDYDLEGNKPKYIYKLHEIKTPNGYYIADGEGDYYFYETKKGAFTERPDTVIENAKVRGGLSDSTEVHEREVGTTIQLTNDKMKFDVQKKWFDNDPSGRSDSVTVELWQSDEPPAGVSGQFHKVTFNIEYIDSSSNVIKTERRTMLAADGKTFRFIPSTYDNTQLPDTIATMYYDSVYYDKYYYIKEPVTEDKEYTIRFNAENASSSFEIDYYDRYDYPMICDDPLFDKTKGNAVLIDTVVLNDQNGWFAEFGRNGLDSSKYYYIIENDDNELYNKSYVVTGLQNSGTFELENVEDTVPKSNITVNKSWLNDNESDVTSLQFEVIGCSEKLAQPASTYSTGSGNTGAYVKLQFKGSDDAYDYHYLPEFTFDKYIPVEAGKDYKLKIGGRSFANGHVQAGLSYTIDDSAPEAVFDLSIPENAEGEISVPITITYSIGLSQIEKARSWGWKLPTSDNYEISCEDEDGETVTIYDSEDDYIAATAAAGTGADGEDTVYPKAEVNIPDENTILVPSKTFTVTKDNETGTWSGTSPLLPLSVNGEPVYYYIREADGTDFIPISYSSNGFTLNEGTPKKVTVVNQKTESNGFELPETGGHGSKPYIIIGAGLMICAGTLYIFQKRRNEKTA